MLFSNIQGPSTQNTSSFEPNDTAETSLEVKSGKIYQSVSETDIDQDVYQFTTSQDGEVYISLENTTGGYWMYLYDSYGNSITGDYYSTPPGNTIVLDRDLKQGTYYVKIQKKKVLQMESLQDFLFGDMGTVLAFCISEKSIWLLFAAQIVLYTYIENIN